MRFEDVLPYLASAYRRSLLVPFIGSGMSVGACTNWEQFVAGLGNAAGLPPPVPSGDTRDTSALYRLADKAVLGLNTLGARERIEAYRSALNAGGKAAGTCVVPAQTQALAQCYWPLVLSTNYDDLYLASRMAQSDPAKMSGSRLTGSSAAREEKERAETDIPEVLGRSIEDSHKVLRSLDSQTRPLLWALQGFLGGQAKTPDALIPEPLRRQELANQVVVGHQQYQQAINTQPHFRRSFAEVFSRRSLLFLGSGILEDYLINLFGEIAHNYGPGPHPHFALFCRQSFEDPKDPSKNKPLPDPQFFQMRLGITPVLYEKYEELPRMLDRLAEAVGTRTRPSPSRPSQPVSWMPDELGFSLADGLPPAGAARRLRLRYAPLSVPGEKGECVIVSVGRTRDDKRPIHGSQATGLLEKALNAGLVQSTAPEGWTPFRGSSPSPLAYRFGDTPLFAVAARIDPPSPPSSAHPNDPEDDRDLGIIVDAVSESLLVADQAGFTHVHLGPVASGQYRLWTPLHPFIQTLAGVRQFFQQHPHSGIQLVELYIFSPLVWFPIVAGKVPVGEVLSSRMMKTWVEVKNPEGVSEIFAVTTGGPAPVTIQTLKELCGLPLDRWNAELLPRSGKAEPSNEDDRLVTPASIVVFSPRPPASLKPGGPGVT